MRYHNTGKTKENGVVYTPIEMANYVASKMLKYRIAPLDSEISILDPAVGKGELLIAMLNALNKQKKITVIGYETDRSIGKLTQKKLETLFPGIKIEIRITDFLEAVENGIADKYDFVIANPPYIRTQIMGSTRAQEIAQKLSLTGRIDIYYAFLLYTKEVLKPNGIAGYITSNKFMTIKAGSFVRNYMVQNYQLHHITDLGDTKLFRASVLPCIVIFSLGKTIDKKSVDFISVYQAVDTIDSGVIQSIFESIHKDGVYRLPDNRCYRFQQGTLQSVELDELWTIASGKNKQWLSTVESNTWRTFSEIGRIRVGIKTTADNVFIGNKWTDEASDLELLRPLITHRNAGQIVANKQSQWKVLYTHTTEYGKKVAYDIDKYPKSKSYLLKHYEQLNGRSYIKKANRNWYEIWVPQNPDSWKHRKIVFRDISEQPQFWLDETGAIVNGDCYWIDIFPEVMEDVVYLALAVANSTFIEKYYDIKFNTKLYSGKRRYQTQYVDQFPIPYYNTDSARNAISLVKKIIAGSNGPMAPCYKEELDSLVEDMFS
ncbi:N-6 DNA methylase [Akkermansia glycaniphila]|uniref:Eco57I restriction-modification methylase domain-containing protein n=1 Tax=Akkermansia glycaniphila TaxID=1679444 RepID=UPI001C0313D8|nr:N-6 DNA methylase [Akkermansia glycaniphila]MBT9450699.1 N-6 DNA methylase [Akkermansia glycaniphila]